MRYALTTSLVLATAALTSCNHSDEQKVGGGSHPHLSARKIVVVYGANDPSNLAKTVVDALKTTVSSDVTSTTYPPTGATSAKFIVIESSLATPLIFDASVCGVADKAAHGAVIRKVGNFVDGPTRVLLPVPNSATDPIPDGSFLCAEP